MNIIIIHIFLKKKHHTIKKGFILKVSITFLIVYKLNFSWNLKINVMNLKSNRNFRILFEVIFFKLKLRSIHILRNNNTVQCIQP